MRKLLKPVAALLSMALLAGILASCGGNGAAESSAGGKTDSSAASSTTESTVHTLKILGPDPGNPDIKYSERDEYEVWHALEDLMTKNGLNLEIETVPSDQYTVVIQTRMASSNLPDIANCSNIDDASLLTLGKNGTIQELGALISQYSNGNIDRMYSEVFPSGYPLIKTAENQIYWLTNLHRGGTCDGRDVYQGLGLQIRYDWLQKIGKEMPTTLAEFTDDIRAFRSQDVNGSGQEDEIILVDAQTFQNGLAQLFGLGNGLFALDTVNDKVVSPWYQDSVKDYFTYLKGPSTRDSSTPPPLVPGICRTSVWLTTWWAAGTPMTPRDTWNPTLPTARKAWTMSPSSPLPTRYPALLPGRKPRLPNWSGPATA